MPVAPGVRPGERLRGPCPAGVFRSGHKNVPFGGCGHTYRVARVRILLLTGAAPHLPLLP